jgi:cytidine deaminase
MINAKGPTMMNPITNDELIASAAAIVKPMHIGDHLVGDVGCALVTDSGHIYLGVCIDLPSGIGFCAEHSAIAAMVTAGEFRIEKIVAVWKDDTGATYVISPCGRCREFIHQIHPDNLATDVIMAADSVMKLADLLPFATSFQKVP